MINLFAKVNVLFDIIITFLFFIILYFFGVALGVFFSINYYFFIIPMIFLREYFFIINFIGIGILLIINSIIEFIHNFEKFKTIFDFFSLYVEIFIKQFKEYFECLKNVLEFNYFKESVVVSLIAIIFRFFKRH